MNPELEAYYNYLKGAGADVPESLKDFQYNLQDEVSAKTYYDYLKKNQFDTPETFEDFAYNLGVKKKYTPLPSGVAGPVESEGGLPTPEEYSAPLAASPEQLVTTVPAELGIQNPDGPPPTVLVPEGETFLQRKQRENTERLRQMVPKGMELSDFPELVAGGSVNTVLTGPVKMVGAVDEVIWNNLYKALGKEPDYESAATRLGKKMEEFYAPKVTPEIQGSFAGQVATGLGTAAGMMMAAKPGIPSPLAKTPTVAQSLKQTFVSPAAFLGGTMTAIPEYEAAKAAGKSNDELFGVLMKNYLVGQTEALPVQRMMENLSRATGGSMLNRVLKASVQGGIEEAFQEGLQTYLTNEIAKGEYDPDRDPFWQVMESAAVGGVVGLMLPGIGAAITNAPPDVKEKIAAKVEELQVVDQAVKSGNITPEQAEIMINAPEGDLGKKPVTKAKPSEQKSEVAPTIPTTEVQKPVVAEGGGKAPEKSTIEKIKETEFGKEHIVVAKVPPTPEKKEPHADVLNHPYQEPEAKEFVEIFRKAREVDYKKNKVAWQGAMEGIVNLEALKTGKNPNGKKADRQEALDRVSGATDILKDFIEQYGKQQQQEDTPDIKPGAETTATEESGDKPTGVGNKEGGLGTSTEGDQTGGTPEGRVTQQISDLIGKEKLDKRAIEKIGREAGIDDQNQVKELAELAVVQKARELAKTDDFEGLVKLYEDQPNLTHRTNESIKKQQYSTPAPIAYMMGKFVGADQKGKKVLEPSAGNGMLTIVGNPETYTVNEIDQTRLKNLNTQGFGEVLSQDGSKDFKRDKQYDAVITNPPFGGTQAQDISGYKMNELAQIMAVKGLNAMKDNGKASIIIGGNNEFDSNGRMRGRDRIFFNYLFNNYNVEDVIDIDGDIYRKQGASFPIRVILVNGRKAKPDGATPLKDFFGEQESDFEGIRNRIQKFISNENIQPAELESGAADSVDSGGVGLSTDTEQGVATPAPDTEVSTDGGKGKRKSKPAAVDSGPVADTGAEQRPLVDSGVNPDERSVPETPVREGLEDTVSEQQQSEGTEGTVQQQQPRADRQRAGGAISGSTVEYKPLSKATSLELKTPAGMAQELLDAQTQLENEVGDIDDFVMDRLKYANKEELYNALSAEQIDGVALAIRNIERGTGIIIGDATGIGKGRQAAAIIRYADKQGGPKPIFLSEKPGLFSDIWRDLVAIGSGDLKPFMVNTYSSGHFESIVDTETGIEYHKAPASNSKEWQRAIDQGMAPKGTNVILSTYSQFSNPKVASKKIDFLTNASKGAIIIMDEAHNASGAGNTGALFQSILPDTKGVVYLSGTFAKRADNMPLYATKTSMSEANMSEDALVDAVSRGGIALQEIISSQLVDSGEMIRRQRSFEGVEVKNFMLGADDAEQQKKHQQAADHVTDLMREIINFQKEYVKPLVKQMDKEAAKDGEMVTLRGGTNMAGVDNQPYFSKVFNVVNQLLYSIKSKDTAKLVVEELKAGRKPFVAIRSTMEAMLTDLMERGQMEIGDVIDADFRFILRKGLEGVMRISVKDAQGNSVKRVIPQGDLSMQGQKEFGRIMSKIGKLTTGLSISPIDELVEEVKKAGYSIGEVTGRKLKLKFLEGGKAMIEARKKEPTNKMYQKYNSGDFDVIVVNSSGSTGASAQSSPKFKDQRQRSMVILEPELNISTLVQLLGRVNRTGQISLPMYTFVTSSIPAEQRLMMMTMRKLKSLDANTTSNQKQSKGILEVPEIFNKYGDRVVVEYLLENPELIPLIDDPLNILSAKEDEIKTDGAANKVTGRVAILPVSEQNKFYNEVTERYVKQIEFLNEAGLNDLEVKQLPLNAKSVTKELKVLGKGGRSKFGTDTFLESLEVDVLKKPLTQAEINEQIKELGGEEESITARHIDAINAAFEKQSAEIIEADQKSTAIRIESIRESTKLSETEKEDRIGEITRNDSERQEGRIKNAGFKKDKLISYFRFFKPGRAVKIAGDLSDLANNVTYTDAIFLGYDINENKPKPYLPSNITLKFAINDSRRLLSIPASKQDILDNIRANSYNLSESYQENVRNKWDDLKKPKGRTRRFFVTGNILQGLGNAAFRGPIVKYTTEDGFIDTGIMLPESFDPKEEGVAKSISVPARKALAIMTGSPTGTEFKSSDAIWSIKKDSIQRYELRLPRSKAVGGKYYNDDDINSLVDRGIWDSSGQNMVAYTDSSRLEALLEVLTNRFGTAFEVDAGAVNKAIENQLIDFSKQSGGTYENFNAALSAPFPVIGKVKKVPQNTELIEKLRQQIKFPTEIEERFTEAGAPVDKKPNALLESVKEFITGFNSHFKYISEKEFPREANLLRVFETVKKSTNTKALTYIKGLVEPLTPEQYDILRRRIILEDMLHSIDRGENMAGLDGKLPFGFEDKAAVQKALDKIVDLAESDSRIMNMYDNRTAFMKNIETMLVEKGLLTDNERQNYYHRRVLSYQYDDFDQSIIHGRHLGKKTRSWQMGRTGSRGLDYSTHFIETEYKVVAEALYELEKQRILGEVMAPYEAQMKRIKRDFALDFQRSIDELEREFGEDSEEVEIRRQARRSLLSSYIDEHLPEGYIAWQPDEGNVLFYKKNVGERRVEGAIEEAMNLDMTGMGYATPIVQGILGDMEENLMMGGKRKEYMIPEKLAQQLDYMGKSHDVGSLTKLVQEITAIWKVYVLLNPNRFVKYNLNNFFGDIDGALAADPTIIPKIGQAWKEVKRYKQTGEATDDMMGALREGVIDSGWELSELNALSDEQWVKFLMTDDNGPDLQDVFGKKVYKSLGENFVQRPKNVLKGYFDWAKKWTGIRENTLRYAAYLRAKEKVANGDTFYWASIPESVDAIKNPEQRAAKLAREAIGDYGNISISGQQFRKLMIPFYSFLEINMKRYYRLFKNAGTPSVQRAILASGLRRGIPAIGIRMMYSYAMIGLFTALVQAWNYLMFPEEAEKLRRTNIRGMQFILMIDDDGKVISIPIVGALYDFADTFGIPDMYDAFAMMFNGTAPQKAAGEAGKSFGWSIANKAAQQVTPLAKYPAEALTGLQFFPDASNPRPIKDYGEWAAGIVSLQDEYKAVFGVPTKQPYIPGHIKKMFLNELDPEELAYYQARAIVQDWAGRTIRMEPDNAESREKKDLLHKYSLSLRYGQDDQANQYLEAWLAAGGDPSSLKQRIRSESPFDGLPKPKRENGVVVELREQADLLARLEDPEYQPQTQFVKDLTSKELAIFRDALAYYERMYDQKEK